MAVRLIRLLFERRWVVLGLAAAVVALSAVSVSRIQFDNTIETWFLDEDPSLAVYNHFTETFRSDQIIVVGVFADDVFAPRVVAAIDQLSDAAAGLEYADRVRSITRSAFTSPDSSDLRAEVLASPLLRSTLLSKDGGATAIVIHYSRDGNTFERKRAFVKALRDIAREATAGLGVDYAITGAPVIGETGDSRNSRDMRILVPAMILLVAVIAFSIFQSAMMTLLPLGVGGIAVLFAYGFMAAVGWAMTMISVILVPLILAVSVAHSIHIIDRYRLNLDRGMDNEGAVRASVERLIRPCFFTCVTTVIGLLSLLVSNLDPVQEFAVTAAVGVLVAFVNAVTVLPALLLFRSREIREQPTIARSVVTRLLELVHGAAGGHPRKIVLLGILLSIGFGWLATRVETGIDTMSWIRHDDPIRVDTERIDRAFGGAMPIEFLLTSPDGRLGEPAMLRRMEALQAWLVDNTGIERATSLADLVKEAARLARDGREEDYTLPRTRIVTNELLNALQRKQELDIWVTAGYTDARIAARVPLSTAQEIIDNVPAIRRHIDQVFDGSGISVELTGQAVLSEKLQTHMLDSQLRSFAVALGAVSLVMIVLLRTVALGALAMIPNLLPIAIGLGSMTLLDIPLNPATVMIAAVALGIVVDDTVHLMTAFERGVGATGDVGGAVRSTLLEVGQPVTVTSILLAAGFAVLILGSFLPTRQIGGLMALIVVAALITDLVFLPAVLRSIPVRLLRPAGSGPPSPSGDSARQV